MSSAYNPPDGTSSTVLFGFAARAACKARIRRLVSGMIPEHHTVRIFAESWVSRNLQAITDPARLQFEVGCWAAQMTADARQQGIGGRDLAQCLGDLDDYLTAQYHEIPVLAGAGGLRDS